MKKKFWIPVAALVIAVVFTACLKNDDDATNNTCVSNTLTQDQAVIDSFKNATGQDYLTYNPTYYGYYGISNVGTGTTPTSGSIIAFKRTISTFKGSQIVTVQTDSVYNNSTGGYLRVSDFDNTTPFYDFLNHAKLGGSMRIITLLQLIL